MKEFDFTCVPEDLKENMLGVYKSTLETLEIMKQMPGEEATLLELLGHGVFEAQRRVEETEKLIQQTIDLFQGK
jgi:hypothetical protein